MSTYDNTDSGVLFKNDKGDNEKRPDYKGKINVEGKDFQLAGWISEPKNGGQKFIKLKVSEEKPKTESKVADPIGDDDDIPF